MRNPFKRPRTALAADPAPVEIRSTGIQLAPYGALRGNFYEGRWGGAMQIPAVYRAATLLSAVVASMPIEGRRGGQLITPTPPMLADPAAGIDNSSRVLASWVLDGLFEGNAIGVVAARNADGWPTAILPVPARWVTVRYYNGGAYNLLDNYGSLIEYVIQDHVFARHDIFHVKFGPCEPGALRGVGLLENAIGTFNLAGEQIRQARALAEYGIPTGLLQAAANSGVTQAQMQEAKESWIESQQTRTIAALAPDVTFQPLGWDPSEAQMLEAREFTSREIALIFGVPASMIESGGGKGSDMVYANISQADIQFLKYSIDAPILVPLEQELSRHMPRGCSAHFDRAAVLAMDLPTRWSSYAVALGSPSAPGWMLPNEVRVEEGYEPLPEFEPVPADEVVEPVNQDINDNPASQPSEDPTQIPLPADDTGDDED